MVRRRRHHGGLGIFGIQISEFGVLMRFTIIGLFFAVAMACAESVWERSPWDNSPMKSKQGTVHQRADREDQAEIKSAPNTIVDSRDNQIYKTININGIVWMAENLNYKSAQSFCFNNIPNCKKDGRLYTWHNALHACPPGTRLPTVNDWETALGYSQFEESLTLSGYRAFNESFYDLGKNGAYWTAEENDDYNDYAYYFKQKIGYWQKDSFYKDQANSVRCIVEGSKSTGAHKWGGQ